MRYPDAERFIPAGAFAERLPPGGSMVIQTTWATFSPLTGEQVQARANHDAAAGDRILDA